MVTRRNFDASVDTLEERTQVTSVMTVINSHMHRFTELRFNVMFSSSLPPFPDDIRSPADQLHTLALECREDDGGPNSANIRESVPLTESRYPNLQSLSIDGRNYYNICERVPELKHMLEHVYFLAISHFKLRPGESFPFHQFFLAMPALRSLRTLQIGDIPLSHFTPLTPRFPHGRITSPNSSSSILSRPLGCFKF
jgi:hypothetical protein